MSRFSRGRRISFHVSATCDPRSRRGRMSLGAMHPLSLSLSSSSSSAPLYRKTWSILETRSRSFRSSLESKKIESIVKRNRRFSIGLVFAYPRILVSVSLDFFDLQSKTRYPLVLILHARFSRSLLFFD